MMKKRADIVVIGGGVIGLSIAYDSALQGASVILVEKNRIPSGSSYGNAGLIVASHCDPLPTPKIISEGIRQLFDPSGAFTIRLRPEPALFWWLWKFYRHCTEKHFFHAVEIFKNLSQITLRLHGELADKAGASYGYRQTGLLHLYADPQAFQESKDDAAELEKYGVKSTALTGDEVRNLDPALSPHIAGAVQTLIDSQLSPAEFLEWLSKEAQKAGAHIQENTEVLGFGLRHRGIQKVITTRGEVRGDQFVLAAGSWTPLLAKKLNLRIPIQAAKGCSMTFTLPKGSPQIPLILHEAYIAVSPFADKLRITGVLELSGIDWRVDLKRLSAIQYHARAYLPNLGSMDLLEIWRGFRPCTPDGLPIIGKADPFSNLWIAGGHDTKGMTHGPATGKLMSDLLSGKSIAPFEKAFKVNRF